MKPLSFAKVLLGAALLLILPLIAGRPGIFTDTVAYFRLGEQIGQIAHIAPAAPPPAAAPPKAAVSEPAAPAAATGEDPEKLAYTVAGARSPYWSFFLYLTQHFGTAWATIAVQALLAAWAIYALFRSAGVQRSYLPAMLVLAFGSSLPLLTGFLMPDVLTGLSVIAILGLLVYWRELALGEKAGLWLLLAFALASHTSHLLLAAALTAMGAILLLVLRTSLGQVALRCGLVAVAMVLAVAGGAAYGVAVKAMKGETLYSPPMLTARLLDDGPGRVHLKKACAADPKAYALCAYADRPMDDANTFLWSDDPVAGVFQSADYATRVRLIGEQPRFVMAVLADDPAAFFQTSVANFATQLVTVQIYEITGDPTANLANPGLARMREILPGAEACLARGDCAPRLPRDLLNAVQIAVALAAAVVSAVLLWRLRRADLSTVAALVVTAYVANAAACGILSGVFQRYQARVVWLIPLLALLLWAAWREQRLRPRLPPPPSSA